MEAVRTPQLGDGVRLFDGRLVDETLDRTFRINATMEQIVAGLADGLDVEEIAERYASIYGLEPTAARREVEAVVATLERSKLLASARRTRVVTINSIQQMILNHRLVFPIQLGIMKVFDWYFRIILKVLGGAKP